MNKNKVKRGNWYSSMTLFRHPNEYILVRDREGNLMRHSSNISISPKFEEVTELPYNSIIYDKNGRLNSKFWMLKRVNIEWKL